MAFMFVQMREAQLSNRDNSQAIHLDAEIKVCVNEFVHVDEETEIE